MSKKLQATLVHGNTFVYQGRFFENGVAMEITEGDQEYLEENAIVRNKSSNGRVFEECQFSFEEVDEDAVLSEDEDEADKAPKVKTRSTKTKGK